MPSFHPLPENEVQRMDMQDRFEDAREIFFSQHPELLADVEAVGA